MREAKADLWDYLKVGAVICVTTNGQVRNGANVMGKGCAKEARDRCPGVAFRIGNLIKQHDNRCFRLPMGMLVGFPPQGEWTLVAFPTKHHWREPSDPKLIIDSCEQLVAMADKFEWTEVVMPRPGCGNGQLNWVDVKEMIEPMLDNRFLVISNKDYGVI